MAMSESTKKWVLRGGSIVVVLIAWQLVGSSINPIFLSTPSAIAAAFVRVIADGELIKALGISVGVVLAGFTLATLVGVPIGLMMGWFRTFEYLVDPYVNALYVVPRIALIPLIIIWFGLGVPAQIVVVFGTSVFPILLSTYAGVRNVPHDLVETARAFGATGAAVAPACAAVRGVRPLRTARSSAAVGRSPALGERHRCRMPLTSAFVAGAGIGPARVGGVAAYARTRLAYSAWSSRQYGCVPARSSCRMSPQVNTSDSRPGVAPRVRCSGDR